MNIIVDSRSKGPGARVGAWVGAGVSAGVLQLPGKLQIEVAATETTTASTSTTIVLATRHKFLWQNASTLS